MLHLLSELRLLSTVPQLSTTTSNWLLWETFQGTVQGSCGQVFREKEWKLPVPALFFKPAIQEMMSSVWTGQCLLFSRFCQRLVPFQEPLMFSEFFTVLSPPNPNWAYTKDPVSTCNSNLPLQPWIILHKLFWAFTLFLSSPSEENFMIFFSFFFFFLLMILTVSPPLGLPGVSQSTDFKRLVFSCCCYAHHLETSCNAGVFSRVCFQWCYSSVQ